MAETFKSDEEYIFKTDFIEDYGLRFMSTGESIVRCKDCKYMTEHYDIDGNVPYWTCSEWDSGTDYDGYCHYGERKESEE